SRSRSGRRPASVSGEDGVCAATLGVFLEPDHDLAPGVGDAAGLLLVGEAGVSETDGRTVLALFDVPVDGRSDPVRWERLRAPHDARLVGLLEAKIERRRRDCELDLQRLADLGRNLGAARPEALDPIARLHSLEYLRRWSVDIEAEQHIGHLTSFILVAPQT